MKKITGIILLTAFSFHANAQTTITQLPPIAVKTHWMNPVKIEGTGSLFFLEGFGGQKINCFRINLGQIDRNNCDKFIFEFAENLNGNPNTPLYFIRRTDGKYLSFQLGGAAFVNKMSGRELMFQKWLINKVVSQFNRNYTNGFNFILPQVPFEFGYTLKVYNNNQLIGFNAGAGIRAGESEFYMGQQSEKATIPNTNSLLSH